MKKKSLTYADLSKKQLHYLKELYIQKKVECMSHKELKEFFIEVISHQINDTIGKEEEMEAWKEMSNFYGDQFELVIQEIQKKYANIESLENFEEDTLEHRLELLEKNSIEKEKQDMWND
ncbi:MAG: hypothetical protein CMC50_00255 [Flavobacteriaceae bacterium]|nr:hypothetical protein [Flavobacteriaceae bacterium]|tara:strand:- start:1233 stop:1592 length:360 start_codon:yes stop_codon:yes gene_type:complete